MLTFAAASLVLVMIPGPDQALITRNALAGGRAAGLLTMVGGALGLSVHVAAAVLGISTLLVASATAFTILKVVGAGYLVWMGIATFLSARRTMTQKTEDADPEAAKLDTKYLRHGFLSNSLNPKVALFFVTFLPQFLPAGHNVFPRALLLSLAFALIYLLWFSLYVLTVDHFGKVLRRPRVRARIEQVTGILLIGFAARLAFQSP
ncbi:LysE family translocator [Streptomyces tubercidicus]|uniref:Lysine transporter LysE n=1 Tax=Streptomyces tubercidicus TaxID=47759 RepID=A0A640UTW6_9ACTN|nr:LysE family translocator [Streptomyces tubercidicus]WAU13614.1 LysE family translocator [Streptomyces tubercidicus]GFE39239.1 lysine transporter LysE [Streptomyces tubercidicus]